MNYIYYFDIAALCLAVVIIIEYVMRSTVKSRQTNAFLWLIATATIATAFDLGSCFALEYIRVLPLWVNHLLLNGFFLSYHALPPLYLYYMMVSSKRDEERYTALEAFEVIVPYAFDIVLTVTNGLHHIVYTIDENYVYHTGLGAYVTYTMTFIYIGIAAVYFFRRRSILNIRQIMNMVIYTVLLLISLSIQIVYPNVLIINFGVMLSILIMAFTMESPSYYEDQQLGIYNRIAFQTVTSNLIANGKQFAVIGLKTEGLSDFRQIVGIISVARLRQEIAKFLVSVAGKKNVFTFTESRFAIIVDGGDSEVEMLLKKILRRFDSPFEANDEGIRLGCSLCRFAFPRDAQSTENVMNLLEYALMKSSESGRDTVVIADSALLEEKRRSTQVLKILKKALVEGRFSVYYQPIYSVELGRFASAEALLRLYDDDFGFISPEEFVPIAEKNGLIMKIGEYVFREVCRFISENRVWEKGIEYIDVNISPMQCLQDDLYEKMTGIMDEYKLDYSRISLEITETASLLSGKILRENMHKMTDSGIRFSLDDYGTGFANLTTVVEYPFSIVKLDKKMLWTAMKNDKAMTVLRQTIRMMKQLSLELIAEGVETEEQAQLLAYYGCDFFQGYYYAKPQNGESFLKFVSNNMHRKEEEAI